MYQVKRSISQGTQSKRNDLLAFLKGTTENKRTKLTAKRNPTNHPNEGSLTFTNILGSRP